MLEDKPEDGGGDKPILVYTTFPNTEVAEAVASSLVDAGLIACANVIPGMTAIYRWQGERHRDAEVVVILKTQTRLVEQVIAATREQHPYDNPAIVAIEIMGGSADYLSWIMAETAAPKS